MKAIDTNVLVHALVDSGPFHAPARTIVTELANGVVPWAIPWPCLYECLRVVTHPKVFAPPVPPRQALNEIHTLVASPTVVLLGETKRHLGVLDALLKEVTVTGNLMHDAHIAALCIEHGVSALITGDSDFLRFPGITVENPFQA